MAGLPRGGGAKWGSLPQAPSVKGPKFQSILFVIHIAKHLQTAPSLGILPQILSCALK